MATPESTFFQSLGVSQDAMTNPAVFIQTVRQGVPGSVVKRAVDVFGNRDLVVRLLGTTSGNLSRYYRVRRMSSNDSEEMLDAIRLYGDAVRVFGDAEKAKEWLATPIPALAGERPDALFDTFRGRQWVAQVLRQIEYGEFV